MYAMRRTRHTAIVAVCIMIATAAASSAAPSRPAPKPAAPDYVILDPNGPDAVTTAEGVFMPMGPIDKDTLIVVENPDGSLPGGMSMSDVAALARARAAGDVAAMTSLAFDADPTAVAAAGNVTAAAAYSYAAAPNIWTAPYRGTNIIGTNSSVRVYYSFSVTPATNQQAAGQGTGYYVGYNGSQFGTWMKWYGLGIASDGSNGGGSVPWGNVAATAQFRAMSTVLHGAFGYFTAS